MRRVLISILKIVGFFTFFALLLAPIVLTAVYVGGHDWFNDIEWRVFVEIGGTLAAFAVLLGMALLIDRRGIGTLGFDPGRLFDLLGGTLLGAAIFVAPLALLMAMGAARIAPDIGAFSATASKSFGPSMARRLPSASRVCFSSRCTPRRSRAARPGLSQASTS
jgi:hypothetical protein